MLYYDTIFYISKNNYIFIEIFVRRDVTVDEIRRYFKVKRDKELKPILNVSPSTISNWRNKGIPLLWQQAIQLQTNNELIARDEDINISETTNGDSK